MRDSVLYPAMDRAEIERGPRTHGFHIFRHPAGSIIHEKTGSVKLAQIQLGHGDMGTTANIYVHTDDEQLRYAAEVLAEARGMMDLSDAKKKGRLLAARIAGEGFEPPTFGL